MNLVADFIQAPTNKINSYQDRVNILIMGVGGKDHSGGDLTDTMILVSVNLEKLSITTISIPRDLWIPQIRAKINSAYHYGGIGLAKTSTEQVLGMSVNYVVVLDFSGFKDIVDALGGITVNVDTAFTDNLYPVAGRENDLCGGDRTLKCRYESLTFTSGPQQMSGETALKFVRSRHSESAEGTDTAREARQQKVISAIESRFLDPKVFLNPKKDLAILRVVMKSLETDINSEAGAVIARKVFDSRKSVVKYLIPDNLLINPKTSPLYDKQYVFIPKLGNGQWEEIHKWVRSLL